MELIMLCHFVIDHFIRMLEAALNMCAISMRYVQRKLRENAATYTVLSGPK